MSRKEFDLGLYLITDSIGLSEDEFLQRIQAAVDGGVTIVQLREKDLSSREIYERAVKVFDICRGRVPLIIDDQADIALAVGADGVHVGASDLGVDVLRRVLGKDMIIGSTAKTVQWAQSEQLCGADYLGVGAVYPTSTKSDAAAISMQTFRSICDSVNIPIAAIGGLGCDNLDILKNSGADGIAVSSAIMRADDPKAAAKILKSKVKEILHL